ncbi:hypothetical protein NL517_30235, partial [Klebsiella pneumoniae]|nr:hypothetical protein [Klebsiella pneumoniae]
IYMFLRKYIDLSSWPRLLFVTVQGTSCLSCSSNCSKSSQMTLGSQQHARYDASIVHLRDLQVRFHADQTM